MRQDSYPEWAPSVLVDAVRLWRSRAVASSEVTPEGAVVTYDVRALDARVELVERLLRDLAMEGVWGRHAGKEMDLVREVEALIPKVPVDGMTEKQWQVQRTEIVCSLRKLGSLLELHALGGSSLSYFNDTELTGMQLALLGVSDPLLQLAAVETLPPIPAGLQFVPFVTGPSTWELLGRLADEIERGELFEEGVVARPGQQGSERLAFVRRLGSLKIGRKRRFSNDDIASLANVVFPNQLPLVGADDVGSLLRSRKSRTRVKGSCR